MLNGYGSTIILDIFEVVSFEDDVQCIFKVDDTLKELDFKMDDFFEKRQKSKTFIKK